MTETDLTAILHRCIDDCGYSFTACLIVSRMVICLDSMTEFPVLHQRI